MAQGPASSLNRGMRPLPVLTAAAALALSFATPAAARGDWTLDTGDKGRKVLVFVQDGEPWASLTCSGKGEVTLSAQMWSSAPTDEDIAAATSGPDWSKAGRARLHSGTVELMKVARLTINQDAAVWVADVALGADEPVYKAFAQTGAITVTAVGDAQTIQIDGKAKPLLGRLMAGCK